MTELCRFMRFIETDPYGTFQQSIVSNTKDASYEIQYNRALTRWEVRENSELVFNSCAGRSVVTFLKHNGVSIEDLRFLLRNRITTIAFRHRSRLEEAVSLAKIKMNKKPLKLAVSNKFKLITGEKDGPTERR